MTAATAPVVVAGALAGGFVSGLAGFGTGIVALGLWLHVLEPAQAATLVVACSVTAQAQTLPAIRHALDARRKDYRRGVFQGYNAAILALTLAAHAAGGLVTREVGWLYLAALPGPLVGVQVGLRVYRRMSERGFERAIVPMLGASGLALILANAAPPRP